MSLIVDLLSTLSIVGIWPRFIEPRLVSVTELEWRLTPTQAHLDGLVIVQLSDLHFHKKTSHRFLNKILKAIREIQPDIILFTGDFICYAHLEDALRLKAFLQQLKAPHGSFCIFGNHDYERYVSLNQEGIYTIASPISPLAGMMRGLRLLFSSSFALKHRISDSVRTLKTHAELIELLQDTPFQILENKTITLPIGLNICGLGELSLGRHLPKQAFASYNSQLPGIILSHNPDTVPELLPFPGDWILMGHTHGEQIHVPWPKCLRKCTAKLARLENSALTRGLHTFENKQVYINRGLGGHKPFRLFSPPEICILRAQK